MLDLVLALVLLSSGPQPTTSPECYDAVSNPEGIPCLPRVDIPADVSQPPAVEDGPPTPWNIPGLPVVPDEVAIWNVADGPEEYQAYLVASKLSGKTATPARLKLGKSAG